MAAMARGVACKKITAIVHICNPEWDPKWPEAGQRSPYAHAPLWYRPDPPCIL